MKKKEETIKIFSDKPITIFIGKAIYILLVISILYSITFLINTTITQNKYLSIFGISFIVTSEDNMQPDICKNSLIIVKKTPEQNLKIGTIVSYNVNGQIRTNKIVEKKVENGNIKYTTKSNKNYYYDIEELYYNNIIGEEILTIGGVGAVVRILQNKCFLVFVIIILILKFAYNKELYKNKRKRKMKKKLM